METTNTTEERFNEKFTDNGKGWRNVWIYRDGGEKIIEELKNFIESEKQLVREETVRDLYEMALESYQVIENYAESKGIIL